MFMNKILPRAGLEESSLPQLTDTLASGLCLHPGSFPKSSPLRSMKTSIRKQFECVRLLETFSCFHSTEVKCAYLYTLIPLYRPSLSCYTLPRL